MHISWVGYVQRPTKAQVERLSAYKLPRLCAAADPPLRGDQGVPGAQEGPG